MQKTLKPLLFNFVLLFGIYAHADTIVVATNDWTPYNTAEGTGLVDQIVQEAFALVGHEVSYSVQPWARAYISVSTGIADMTYPWSYSEERDAEITFNESPLMVNRSIFWHQAGKPFSWNSFEDLKAFSIGGMIGYSDTELLEQNDVPVSKVQTEIQNLKKLIAGRVDAFAMNEVVGNQIINENLTESEKSKIAAYQAKALVESNMHGVFSPNEKGQKLAEDFEKGLQMLKASGRYDEILYQ